MPFVHLIFAFFKLQPKEFSVYVDVIHFLCWEMIEIKDVMYSNKWKDVSYEFYIFYWSFAMPSRDDFFLNDITLLWFLTLLLKWTSIKPIYVEMTIIDTLLTTHEHPILQKVSP